MNQLKSVINSIVYEEVDFQQGDHIVWPSQSRDQLAGIVVIRGTTEIHLVWGNLLKYGHWMIRNAAYFDNPQLATAAGEAIVATTKDHYGPHGPGYKQTTGI